MKNKDLSIGDKVETPISKIQGEIVQLGFQEGKDYYDIAFENGARHWMLDCEIRKMVSAAVDVLGKDNFKIVRIN